MINETQLGSRIRHLLNQKAVSPEIAERLRVAREHALDLHRETATVPVLAWAGPQSGSRTGGGRWKLLVSMLVMLVGLSSIYLVQEQLLQDDVEELDTQVLTADLPVEAYLDKGFETWLRKRVAE